MSIDSIREYSVNYLFNISFLRLVNRVFKSFLVNSKRYKHSTLLFIEINHSSKASIQLP